MVFVLRPLFIPIFHTDILLFFFTLPFSDTHHPDVIPKTKCFLLDVPSMRKRMFEYSFDWVRPMKFESPLICI